MLKRGLIFLLKLYKKYLSPRLPGACIYTPTCSEYGMIAISRFGVIKGIFLTAKRLLRCTPFHKGGLDPVPDKKSVYKWII